MQGKKNDIVSCHGQIEVSAEDLPQEKNSNGYNVSHGLVELRLRAGLWLILSLSLEQKTAAVVERCLARGV